MSQTAVQNRNKELESASASRLPRSKSDSSTLSQSSSRSSSSSTQNKERDYRRVKHGTPVDEVLKLRDPMFSPDDPNQVMHEIKKRSTASTMDPSIVIPRDLSIPPPPQDQSGLTKEVRQKIEEQFPNASVLFSYPFIVIAGAKPPTNPISINNLIVEFYDDMQDFKYAPGEGGNPTIKDPVAKELPYSHSSFPSFDALDAIIDVLGDALGIEICSLAVYLHVLVVEVNEKDYDLHKLPGKVAGRSTLWGIKGNTWGKKCADFPRKKVPTGLVVDDSNYKSDGLSPGVKVCGKFKATSSGALIRNIITSEERITVAEHGWGVNESTVFHPDVSQEIGTITDRYPLHDVALCRLNPGLTYTNNKYFSAPPPSHFLNSDEYILKTHPWTWFGVDGFTTGLVWLGAAGIIKHKGRDVAHTYLSERIYFEEGFGIRVGTHLYPR